MNRRAPPPDHDRPDQAAVFLARLTHEFASSLDVGQTLRHAIDRFMAYLNAEAASIFLLEEDGTALVCRECAGPVDIRGLRLAPDHGIVGQTVLHNEPKIVRDVSKNASFAADVDAGTGFITRSILCAPLSVRGQCLGALELLNKRTADGLFDLNDMQLATTVASAAALAIHNARMAAELVQQERVRKELELARQIQESLLPTASGDTLPVYGLNVPAREVSGDFYDFYALPDGRVYFALADVAGKGMNAALLMARTTSLLRCLAKDNADPGQLLARVNDELCETATHGMFVTIVAGFLDPATGRVTWPMPVIHRHCCNAPVAPSSSTRLVRAAARRAGGADLPGRRVRTRWRRALPLYRRSQRELRGGGSAGRHGARAAHRAECRRRRTGAPAGAVRALACGRLCQPRRHHARPRERDMSAARTPRAR